jgi:hypothetical protein
MKKTVQIVTIPLNKKGWSKDELLKHILKDNTQYSQVGDYKLINGGNSLNAKCWQPQQLLVLSDDEVELGDIGKIVKYPFGIGKTIEHGGNHGIEVECITCTMFYNPNNVTAGTKGRFSPDDVYQIIASYPQIEGTLPISKETVQAWIDKGTPEEGSVEMEIDCQAYYGHGGHDCHTPCSCKTKYKVQEYPFSGDAYPKNNLLLEFGNPLNTLIEKNDYNWLPIDETIQEFAVKSKPSVPTDEEVKEKAQEYTRSINLGYIDTDLKGLEDIRTETTDAFEIGYKQALKDLVISKPDEYA